MGKMGENAVPMSLGVGPNNSLSKVRFVHSMTAIAAAAVAATTKEWFVGTQMSQPNIGRIDVFFFVIGHRNGIKNTSNHNTFENSDGHEFESHTFALDNNTSTVIVVVIVIVVVVLFIRLLFVVLLWIPVASGEWFMPDSANVFRTNLCIEYRECQIVCYGFAFVRFTKFRLRCGGWLVGCYTFIQSYVQAVFHDPCIMFAKVMNWPLIRKLARACAVPMLMFA